MAETSTPYKRVNDAAAYLKVSPRTLEKWRRAGTGPRWLRLGSRLVLYAVADLDQWARQSTSSTAPAA